MIEVRDNTYSEAWWPIGLFNDLESANQAVDRHIKTRGFPPHACENEGCTESGISLEFYQRSVGWSEGLLAAKRQFEPTGVVDEGTQIEEWRELHPSEFDPTWEL